MIVDTNVLVYAANDRTQHHAEAKAWLESALTGVSHIGMPWASLLGFQRVVTHPRASTHPLSPATAWTYVEAWLAAPAVWVPDPGPSYQTILGDLIVTGQLRGNLVSDAHLAALAIEYGLPVCSFDTDFARFRGVTWYCPR